MGRHKDELRRDVLEQQFDALGGDGWELVWVLMNQALQGEKDGPRHRARPHARA
jgi:hypothetical protein